MISFEGSGVGNYSRSAWNMLADSWLLTIWHILSFWEKPFLREKFFWKIFFQCISFYIFSKKKLSFRIKNYLLEKWIFSKKIMVIICCFTLTVLFSWLLLHTQAKENSWHPPPNKQSQQSNPYKNYVWSWAPASDT